MNGIKMEKCFEKTHSVVKLLLILWMTSLIHIAVGDFFLCSGSDMNVSMTKVCDGYYDCDNYEDESSCITTSQVGASFFLSWGRSDDRIRFYTLDLYRTLATRGFRIMFQHLYLSNGVQLQIGTGHDPSDTQSVITTIHGYINYCPDDVYVYTSEMWFAGIGPDGDHVNHPGSSYRISMGIAITSFYLSTSFTCSSPQIMPSNVLCDGLYHCDHYEDELACNNLATYLQESKSHFIYIPFSNTSRLYNTIFLQTNATYGFRIVFKHLNLYYDDEVQIGTGNDPSDIQSVIITIHGYTNYAPDDVYVGTNEMWFAVIGAKVTSRLEMDVEIISIDLSRLICKNTTWMSSRFGLINFLEDEKGALANSTEVCPFNTANADQPIGRAICVGDLISQSTWLPDPTDNCGPFRNVGDLLTELSKVIVSDENVAKLSEDVSLVSSSINDISSDDIFSIANIISNISARTNYNEQVTESIVAIVNNIAQVDTETLESASASVSDVIKVFEQQIKSVPVEGGGNFSIQQPNIAVQVQSVRTDTISNGLVLSLARDSNPNMTEFDINIGTPNENLDEATQPDTIAAAILPSAISSAIPSIPVKRSETSGFVRVIFNVFSTPALFISNSLQKTSLGTNRSANTPVISLSIGDEKIENLTEPIKFTFTPIEPGLTNPSCSYWDIGYGDWSQEGCQLLSASGIRSPNDNSWGPPPDERIVCGCNHLTHFAVLMDMSIEERSFEQAHTFLTYIGCGISIVSLLVTLAIYISNRVLREKQTNQIIICLCLTLLCLYVSFIVMISLDSAKLQYQVPCWCIAAFVHFFVLSSITWMGVEGYTTYLIIVKMFDTCIKLFIIKAGAVAWVIPAIIVAVTGGIARDKYAHEDLCFLQLWAQIGGLLIPMTVIILFNVVIFGLVVRELMKSSNIESRENIERVQNAICILLLLGLTYITGYFLMIQEFSQVVEYIFFVMLSSQGLFIFLLYCVRKPVIRKQLVQRQDAITSTTAATTLSTQQQGNSVTTFV